MIHRVDMDLPIDEQYHTRNVVISKERLMEIIELLLDKGLVPGTIEETIHDDKKFHLSFDDGYSEHLKIAKKLKKNFSLEKEHCTFSINVDNSINENYSGMDLIYNIIERKGLGELLTYAKNNDWKVDPNIDSIKEKYITLSPDEINDIRNKTDVRTSELKNLFLNGDQIKKLSDLFNIGSHGITHRDLRNHLDISKKEIHNSKRELETIIGSKVSTMCYPEGKNNKKVRSITKESGYGYGLSINHKKGDPFCVGRYCINRHLDRFMEDLK